MAASSSDSSSLSSCQRGCALVRDDNSGTDPLETVSSNSQRSVEQPTIVLRQNLQTVVEAQARTDDAYSTQMVLPGNYSPARSTSVTRRPSPVANNSHRGGEPTSSHGKGSGTSGAREPIPALNLRALQPPDQPQTASETSIAVMKKTSKSPAPRRREGSRSATPTPGRDGYAALDLVRRGRPSSVGLRLVRGGIVNEPDDPSEQQLQLMDKDGGGEEPKGRNQGDIMEVDDYEDFRSKTYVVQNFTRLVNVTVENQIPKTGFKLCK